MHTDPHAAKDVGSTQFGLAELMEFVTICATLSALSGLTGVMASVFLAMTSLALAMKRGPLALIMLASASVAADWSYGESYDDGLLRQFMTILVGASLCTWFRLRAARISPAKRSGGPVGVRHGY